MYRILFLFVTSLILVKSEDEHEKKYTSQFFDIANTLSNLLGIQETDNGTRINELKEKLSTIDSYVINKEEFAKSLLNQTVDPSLNETNFYYALSDNDKFKFLFDDDPKSLFVKLKERMNRDDILEIVAKRDTRRNIVRSARRMMNKSHRRNMEINNLIDDVIDKVIAEAPEDYHNFTTPLKSKNYWDPKTELEELKEHRRINGRRIFKGDRTTIKHYPFMVSVHIRNRFWCGGVIYWADLVITSASCLQLMHNNRFYRENPKILRVRVGSNHSRLGGEVIDAIEVFFHPSYNPRTLSNNIAIIRLHRQVRFTNHRIPKMIDISHSSDAMSTTSEVLLLGWGVTKLSQKMAYEPIFLQRKILPVYPNKFCQEVYGDKYVINTMFCAGTMTSGEGACDHDAGGPAILAGRLVGIISFGPTICGYPNAPTVFTLVGAYADWIETVNETMPGYYRGRARTTTTTVDPIVLYAQNLMNNAFNSPAALAVRDTLPPLLSTMDGLEGIQINTKKNEVTEEIRYFRNGK